METYKRGNTWYARHVDIATGKTLRTSLKVRVGSPDEDAKVQKAVAALLTGDGPSPRVGGMTLDEAYRKADREHFRDQADRRNVASRYEEVAGFLGKATPIASLTGSRMTELKAHLLDKGNDPKTVNRKLSVVSKILHLAAEEWEVLDRIPVMKRFREKRGRVRWLREDEEATLLAFFEAGAGMVRTPGGSKGGFTDIMRPRDGAHTMAELCATLVDTGMRPGELFRVQDRDITLGAEPAVYIPESKGGAQRSLPLEGTRALAILTRRMRRDKEADAKLRGSSRPFGDFDQDRADKLWSHARRAMGLELDEEFVMYALRHTFAVRMVDQGVDLRVLQYLMGHKKIETTTIYAHVSNRAARDAMQKVRAARQAVLESAHSQAVALAVVK
jgi:site-specific recombinase XerD